MPTERQPGEGVFDSIAAVVCELGGGLSSEKGPRIGGDCIESDLHRECVFGGNEIGDVRRHLADFERHLLK